MSDRFDTNCPDCTGEGCPKCCLEMFSAISDTCNCCHMWSECAVAYCERCDAQDRQMPGKEQGK